MFSWSKNPVYHPRQYAAEVPPGAPSPTPGTTPQYDYIIVGAGAAGSVLASRLSEDSSVSVLVLEAGGNNNVLDSKIPGRYTTLWRSKHDWGYSTVGQIGLDGKQIPWPRGKMIGDLDEWTSVHGCKGWSYQDVAPYFRRMEGFTPNPAHPIDLENRGIDGRWKTSFCKLTPLVEQAFIGGCREVGISASPDFNTPAGTLGVSRMPAFIDSRGSRSSLATSFLAPDVMRRSNLTVGVHSHVSKVLFNDEKPPSAIGVEIQVGSQYFHVTARKEVILCGGAVNTPQLLMLSGIGPEDQLKKHDIPIVKINETVGRNLKDHLATWFFTGRGDAASNAAEAAAFIRTSEFKSKGKSTLVDHGSCNLGPDIELICVPFGLDVTEAKLSLADKESFAMVVTGLRPQSTGNITLQSADCFASPIIDPNYLSDEGGNDLKVMLAGIRVCIDIIRTPSFSAHLKAVSPNDDPLALWWPSSSSKKPEDIPDEDLIRFLKRAPITLYHPVGTARMGPSPENSVVDLECRVRGVKGLRVIDASVFPEQISGHPTALIGAMAYKLADMMVRDEETDESQNNNQSIIFKPQHNPEMSASIPKDSALIQRVLGLDLVIEPVFSTTSLFNIDLSIHISDDVWWKLASEGRPAPRRQATMAVLSNRFVDSSPDDKSHSPTRTSSSRPETITSTTITRRHVPQAEDDEAAVNIVKRFLAPQDDLTLTILIGKPEKTNPSRHREDQPEDQDPVATAVPLPNTRAPIPTKTSSAKSVPTTKTVSPTIRTSDNSLPPSLSRLPSIRPTTSILTSSSLLTRLPLPTSSPTGGSEAIPSGTAESDGNRLNAVTIAGGVFAGVAFVVLTAAFIYRCFYRRRSAI
ncbi:hypothetical protein CDD80_668 [Ophiocordyceps camponoti-rufipedis]|uniref:Glucose-methanol-choline oxidoreductase N-terminal domain-containing protein n=1 Tax=Ophiocordyceps camponoti-rufipedis TaxID=2004952 RepID=A0A2C5ZDX2_9HYPO|nr:hypothetical protein CDD80_668 [Ophiocordyceps camponoti-rufipedis]